ncbi:MAG: hypothetical protein QXX57_05345 [Nitrososphaerota archaeon]
MCVQELTRPRYILGVVNSMMTYCIDVNTDQVEARIGEINDAIELLKDLTAKSFMELSIHERLPPLLIQPVEAASSISIKEFKAVKSGF